MICCKILFETGPWLMDLKVEIDFRCGIPHHLFFLITSLNMLQSDWLLKCKDIVIMTLRGAKTIFLDTWYATIKKT